MTHIVFDIETVAHQACLDDLALKQMAADKIKDRYVQEKTIEKHLAEIGSDYALNPGTAQVCCIVAVAGEYSFTDAMQDEAQLLRDFAGWIGDIDAAPTLVGFNIRGFDLPVLAAAYIRNGITLPSQIARALTDRRWTIDYYDIFKTGLQRFCQALGLEPLAGTGAQVQGWYDAGDFAAILRHCQDDVRLVREVHERVHG